MSRWEAPGLVALLALVAWGRGGYEPWAVLALELGASAFVLWFLLESLSVPGDEVARQRERYRAWKRLPFFVRHPSLASCLRAASLGLFPKSQTTADVEIFLPSESGESVEIDVRRETFFFGFPFERVGLMPPLVLLSGWILLSLVPLRRAWLAMLSPQAHHLRSGIEALVGTTVSSAPSSLAPFVTLRSFWLWLSVLAVLMVTLRVARDRAQVRRLGLLLLLVGAASGFLGIVDWIGGLHEAFGVESESLRATATFGNPNHFSAFQSMLLLASLGWLAAFRTESWRARRRRDWNDRALAFIAGLAVLLLAVGLALSLSRSGIAFALAGCGAWVFFSRRREVGSSPGHVVDVVATRKASRKRSSMRVYWALALAVGAFVVWFGIEPLLGRFHNLGDEWEREGGRTEIWRDSALALEDYWVTGAGLSSFRYVGARYRTFGGTIFYSWVHNDYLQLAIELGLPGVLLFAWLVVAVWRGALRARRSLAGDPALLDLHSGMCAALVAIALHSFTDFSLHLPANLALLAILVGTVVGMSPQPERSASEASRGASQIARAR